MGLQTGWRQTPVGGIAFDPNAPAYAVKSGDDEFTMAFDSQGLPTRLNGKLHNLTVELTRLFAKGNPQRKK